MPNITNKTQTIQIYSAQFIFKSAHGLRNLGQYILLNDFRLNQSPQGPRSALDTRNYYANRGA